MAHQLKKQQSDSSENWINFTFLIGFVVVMASVIAFRNPLMSLIPVGVGLVGTALWYFKWQYDEELPLPVYLVSIVMINVFGIFFYKESGLIYLYPLAAVHVLLVARNTLNVVVCMGAGYISMVAYLFISPASLATTYPGKIVTFLAGFVALGGLITMIALRMTQLQKESKHHKHNYDQLNTFVEFVKESSLLLLRVNSSGEILLMNNVARAALGNEDNDNISWPPGCSETIMQAFRLGIPQELTTYQNGKHYQFKFEPNQEADYISVYGEDITEIQKTRDRVDELNNAIEFAADGVAIINKSGEFTYLNNSFASLLGHVEKPSLDSQSWFDLWDEDQSKAFKEEVFPEILRSYVWRGESICQRIDGRTVEVLLTITRIPGGSMICYMRDNTAVKAFERDLIDAKDAAEAATKAKSAFLATMSHEIRTPMNGVLGMASLLSATELNADQREFVETLQVSGENLLSIINEILDFSKIEAGKMVISAEPVPVNKLIKNAMTLSSHRASTRNNTIVSHISHRVPEVIISDAGRLSQILNNLVSNAIKFTEGGKIELNVDAKELEHDQFEVSIDVKDTGIGIPEDKLATLFDSFTQVDSSLARKFEGTGLGLAICKKLAELMDGDIKVESTLGEGSTFTFRFITTAKKGANPDTQKEVMEPTLDGTLAKDYPLSILVAEDNLINQRLAMFVLEKMGYSVDLACNGREAVEMARINAYDIIFMDIHMPEMDGIEASGIITTDESIDTPYIAALTANIASESKNECFEAGMSEFILKPFKSGQLELVIRKVAMMKESIE
ncbi:PAS domain-containing hybrid sensor histidine kinase/response regulator [Sanyastnella coralliicola]|uniref:PAS domain-containing hybrid sensor histidine kinase/response regulator n=1 Tax=Sanyastnella coralliicola TaxID=3069118 RepID=UPI0027BAD0F8|nr:PAS domain-containing hybrid sensor histidine kinase/response regulator [Longitalea sp. SCSIO 12813]